MSTRTGGTSAVAAALTDHFGMLPPLSRQRVDNWHKRRTKNREGVPFPRRARGRKFVIADCIEWASAGVPTQTGHLRRGRAAVQEPGPEAWQDLGVVARTKSGRVITEQELAGLVVEAELGYGEATLLERTERLPGEMRGPRADRVISDEDRPMAPDGAQDELEAPPC